MLIYYFPPIFFAVMLTFFCLLFVRHSFDNGWYVSSFFIFIVIIALDVYIAFFIKSGIDNQKDLLNAIDLGYVVYIDGQKSDIDFTSDFIINNYVFTIDDENHYISCTNKYE